VTQRHKHGKHPFPGSRQLTVVAQGAYHPKFGAPFPMATAEPEYAESSSNDRTPIRRDKSQLDTTITKDPV
jgi:hypothetical protein